MADTVTVCTVDLLKLNYTKLDFFQGLFAVFTDKLKTKGDNGKRTCTRSECVNW